MNERIEQLAGKLANLKKQQKDINGVLGKQYLSYGYMLDYAARDIEKKLEEENE